MLGKALSYRLKRILILLGAAVAIGLSPAAKADDIDPIQVDKGHWISLEHYSDNIKHNRPGDSETPPVVTPATDNQVKNAESPSAVASPLDSLAPTTPIVAAPSRPLDLPSLPGVNKGFGLEVDSTADSNATAPAQIVETNDGKSDLQLQEQDWQDAAEMARQHMDEKNGVYNKDSERIPLNVRMTFLPNAKVAPTPSPERKPRPRLAEVPMAPKAAIAATSLQKTPAECAAIDAYKKKQLEAIQSDRKTLQALQTAIADLGLQKQLDFMTGAQQSPTLNPALQNAANGAVATP